MISYPLALDTALGRATLGMGALLTPRPWYELDGVRVPPAVVYAALCRRDERAARHYAQAWGIKQTIRWEQEKAA